MNEYYYLFALTKPKNLARREMVNVVDHFINDFFFYDIDERRRYTKKVHPPKALVGPSIVKRRRRGDLWAG